MTSQENKEIKQKISNLEKKFDTLMKELKKRNRASLTNMIQSNSELDDMSASGNLSSVYERGPNPWTIQTGEALNAVINMMSKRVGDEVSKGSKDTYRKTLKALTSSPKGLTADQVGKKTHRNRNTESAYLWRLYLAGLVEREKHGSKILYRSKNNADVKILEKI